MAHVISIHHFEEVVRDGWHAHPVVATAITATLGAMIGALAFAIVVSTVDVARTTFVGTPSAAPVITTVPRALGPNGPSGRASDPAEYIRNAPVQNLDWIR